MIKFSKHFEIESSKDILGGEPVFRGTRVPVQTLIQYLKAGDRLENFLRDYPTVSKKQAVDFLESTIKGLIKG
jgi:uncharacterized protein (DUF433 family)